MVLLVLWLLICLLCNVMVLVDFLWILNNVLIILVCFVFIRLVILRIFFLCRLNEILWIDGWCSDVRLCILRMILFGLFFLLGKCWLRECLIIMVMILFIVSFVSGLVVIYWLLCNMVILLYNWKIFFILCEI